MGGQLFGQLFRKIEYAFIGARISEGLRGLSLSNLSTNWEMKWNEISNYVTFLT